MKISRNNIAKRCKRLAFLLAAPGALLLSQGQAKAVVNVYIYNDGPNLNVSVTGSISSRGNSTASPSSCLGSGALNGQFDVTDPSVLCTGVDQSSDFYSITGPAGFGGTGNSGLASSVAGLSFQMFPSSYNTGVVPNPAFNAYQNTYAIDPSYVLGEIFHSSAIFNGKSLASEGFTATGLVGTWAITGTSESINVYISPAPTPGPLPLLGAAAAFGWSRRLRKRIATPLITPPQA